MKLPLKDQRQCDAVEAWIELGDYAEAKKELQQIDRRFWNHPEVLVNRWHIDRYDQNQKSCLSIAQTLISEDPDNPIAWFMLGRSLEGTSGPVKALETLEQEIVRQPQQPFLRLEAAILAAKLRRFDDALLHLKLALAFAKASRQSKEVKEFIEEDPILKVLAKSL